MWNTCLYSLWLWARYHVNFPVISVSNSNRSSIWRWWEKAEKNVYSALRVFLVDISIAALFPLFPSVLGKAWSTCRCQNYTSLVPVWRQIHIFAFMGLSFILFWCAAFLFSTLWLLSFHPRLLWTCSVWLGLNVFTFQKPLRPVFWLFFFLHQRCLFIYCSFKDKIGWSDSH